MAGRVWVPGYRKEDGTVVNGYWRDNPQASLRQPKLKGARTFRGLTFRKVKA